MLTQSVSTVLGLCLWRPELYPPGGHRLSDSGAPAVSSPRFSVLGRCAPHCGHRSADDQTPHRGHLVWRCLVATCVAGLSSTWWSIKRPPSLIISFFSRFRIGRI